MSIPNFFTYFNTYSGISELVKTYSFNEIVDHILGLLGLNRTQLLNYPMGGYAKGKNVGHYKQVLEDLIKNISRYDQVYSLLSDETSKRVFTSLIQYRVIPDIQFIRTAYNYDAEYSQYFNKEIVFCNKDEVFVDCGGFTGDTVEEYIRQYQDYKHIYVYEPSDDNIATCRSNLQRYPNITVRNCGVGEINERLPISNSTSSSSFIGNVSGESFIEIVSLDEDIKEKITFLKMDVEGFEIPALLGAKNHIKNDTPKLAICTYHILTDMWEIPLLIKNINPNYSFYFRHYMLDQNWETVLYAIPQKSCSAKTKVPKTAVAFPWQNGWRNVELTKDCGYIPFMLHKNHGMDVAMVGAALEPYPYLNTYVKGLKMDFLSTGSVSEKISYIEQHATEIDLLILRGPYPVNHQLAIQYKKFNPYGKIYVGLDANSHWMDRIIWDNPSFIKFMNCCDVIATSCKAMQKHLNEKWPWKVECIPNGYYNYGIRHLEPDFESKNNVILTVGRLGTLQKRTDILLGAFARIADQIPNWKLKLVGNIAPDFEPFIKEFFVQNPQLVSKVEFTGAILEKEKLFEEYQKAKIFALPSFYEGGTPNVVAEALTAGCVMAVTKFDAWEDAIDGGKCGKAVDVNDIEGFSDILLELCTHSELPQLSRNAYDFAIRNYDMENIVAKLYEMLFGGDMA